MKSSQCVMCWQWMMSALFAPMSHVALISPHRTKWQAYQNVSDRNDGAIKQ